MTAVLPNLSPSFLTPGLVSVSFRALPPAEIIRLAAQAGTPLLEWGGDVHVPPGEIKAASEVGSQTRDAGLTVACYGSYYQVGRQLGGQAFEPCLDSAAALGAPVIRVWAGNCGSAEADPETWERVTGDTRRICKLAGAAGIAVALEFHGGTLADTAHSVGRLLTQADQPNLRTLWQPLEAAVPESRAAEVRALLPHLAHVHVYHWPGGVRVPLADGEREWSLALAALARSELSLGLLLEFVQGDSPEQFLADAATLRRWIAQVQEAKP